MFTLEEKLGYAFKNKALLENALQHSSYANEHRGANFFSNERLEFLGDSVLGFVTAEYLFAKHPTAPEGELTRIRAALVCEESLHEVAQKLELGGILESGMVTTLPMPGPDTLIWWGLYGLLILFILCICVTGVVLFIIFAAQKKFRLEPGTTAIPKELKFSIAFGNAGMLAFDICTSCFTSVSFCFATSA